MTTVTTCVIAYVDTMNTLFKLVFNVCLDDEHYDQAGV